MIEKWTILNLPRREDRRFISVAGAIRMNVPEEKIRFWHGYDVDDFGDWEHAKEVVGRDIPELTSNIDDAIIDAEPGKFLMLWNVARYLRDLSRKYDRIEAFVHDGLMLKTQKSDEPKAFCPSFEWLEDVVSELVEYDPDFKMLTICPHNGWYSKMKEINPITPGSFISHGILSWDNFARVYSNKGASIVLDRIKTQNFSVRSNSVIAPRYGEPNDWEHGFYSSIVSLGSDYPNTWLGSNSMPELWGGLQDEFKRLFGEE